MNTFFTNLIKAGAADDIEDGEIIEEDEEIEDLEFDDEDDQKDKMSLELGDIIEIISPSNPLYHENVFLIIYIDTKKIEITNVATAETYTIRFEGDDNIVLADESIEKIHLLSSSEVAGYARQNELIAETWVDIYFGGDIPAIVTGFITNLEEDSIELLSFPEKETFFIDFEYKGLPENIQKIVIRDKPAQVGTINMRDAAEDIGEDISAISSKEESISTDESTGKIVIELPENPVADDRFRDKLHTLYLDSNDLFEENLDDIHQVVEIPENEKKYNIEIQLRDFIDEFLSTIPMKNRTEKVMKNLASLIERYKELRQKFSLFDNNGNVTGKTIFGHLYKPMLHEIIQKGFVKSHWITPVISQKKKIFDVDTENIIDATFLKTNEEVAKIFDIQNEFTVNKTIGDEDETRYSIMINGIDRVFSPFLEEDTAVSRIVPRDLEAFVSNFGDYEMFSTVRQTNKDSVQKKKFYNQRLLKNEKTTINSFMCMPFSIVKPSIFTQNILSYSLNSLNETFKNNIFFKENTDDNKYVIEDLEKEIEWTPVISYNDEYVNPEKQKPLFINNVRHFVLDESLNGEDALADEKIKKMLNVIIPNNNIFIDMVVPYMKYNFPKYTPLFYSKYSLVDFVKCLKSFFIFPENISYGQYNKIRFYINSELKLYKEKISQDRNKWISLYRIIDAENEKRTKKNFLDKKFDNHSKLFDIFKDYVGMKKELISSSEAVYKIGKNDFNFLFFRLISSILIHLSIPGKLMNIINPNGNAIQFDIEERNLKGDEFDSSTRVLSKKYKTVNKLKDDNNVDIFFDKEYDNTPYSILKEYENERKSMQPEVFMDFIVETLRGRYPVSAYEKIVKLAKTIIEGKKEVEDGHFAILEFSNADEKSYFHYYKRINNEWKRDDTFEQGDFISPDDFFCNVSNIDAKCSKGEKNETDEIDVKIKYSLDELKKKIDIEIVDGFNYFKRLDALNTDLLYRYNYSSFYYGAAAKKDNVEEGSPYLKLLEKILKQTDHIKVQNDICRLYNHFGREPLVSSQGENAHYVYCRLTNKPLIPYSMYELALSFINGNYQNKQNELCTSVGILSQDGDCIVDKYCGNVIRMIDFVDGETYSEANVFDSMGTSAIEGITLFSKQKKKNYDNETTKMIYNIFHTICSNIFIPLEQIEDIVMRFSTNYVETSAAILSEAAYNKKIEKTEKEKGKSIPPYPVYRNQLIISIVGSIILVAIQTAVPSFITKKTFPKCVSSFSGYPSGKGAKEDDSGIHYISCVITNLKSKIEPWDSIVKLNQTGIKTRMEGFIEKYVLTNNEIADLYLTKEQYDLANPFTIVPKEHNVSNWMNFSPPIYVFSVTPKIISKEFHKEFISLIKSGNKDQHSSYLVYISNNLANGFSIIEMVNEIVRNKNVLLKTMTGVPFLENACCDESGAGTKPIGFFKKINNKIELSINNTVLNNKYINVFLEASRAISYFNNENTALITKNISSVTSIEKSETNIYSALIHYANLDTTKPIPEGLLQVIREKPGSDYSPFWSLEEKIAFLKSNAVRMKPEDLDIIIEFVQNRNKIVLKKEDENSNESKPEAAFKDFLFYLKNRESATAGVIDAKLIRILDDFFKNKEKKDAKDKDDIMRKLRNHLASSIDRMKIEIMDFFNKYGNLKRKEYDEIADFIANYLEKNVLTNDSADKTTSAWNVEEDDSIYGFIQNSILFITRIMAANIVNKNEYNSVPKHWGLSARHQTNIKMFINEYYAECKQFHNNATLENFFKQVNSWQADLNMFLQTIPLDIFDKRTFNMLFSYCWNSMWYEFIQTTDDADVLLFNKQERRIKKLETETDTNTDNNIPIEDIVTREKNIGDVADFKSTVCRMLSVGLTILKKDKKYINFSYSMIRKGVSNTKREEKEKITSFLENMENDDRRIEDNFKKYKIGRWNVGMQKGIFKYDKATYDESSSEGIAKLYGEFDTEILTILDGEREAAEETTGDAVEQTVEDLERYDREMWAEEGDNNDLYGLDELGENYMDGVVYEEDVDNDDF